MADNRRNSDGKDDSLIDKNPTLRSINQISDAAKSAINSINKYSVNVSAESAKTISKIHITTAEAMYNQLASMHRTYINDVLKREAAAANQVARMWSQARGNSVNPTITYTINGSSSFDFGTDSFISGMNKIIDGSNDKFGRKLDAIGGYVRQGSEKGTNKGVSLYGETFLKSFNILFKGLLDKFEEGIDRIYQTYERTYTGVSVIMNMDRMQYYKYEKQVQSDLFKNNLENNIAISDVMSKLSEVTQMGISGDKARAKAMADSINEVIAPFVDTTSTAYVDLQNKFGPKFTDKISGMGEYIRQISGSNRVFKGSIDDVITKLAPVELWAKKSLMTGEELARVEALVESGMFTQGQAIELISNASSAMSDWGSAIYSDNMGIRVGAATGASTLDDYIRSQIEAAALVGSDDYRLQSIGLHEFGLAGVFSQNADINQILDEWNKSAEKIANNPVTPESAYDSMLAAFAGDQFTTITSQLDIISENVSLIVAQLKQQVTPLGYNALGSLAGGLIGRWSDSIINVIKGASGSGSAGSAAGGNLAGALGTVAKGSVIAGGIYNTISGGYGVIQGINNGDSNSKIAVSAGQAISGLAGIGAIIAGSTGVGAILVGLGLAAKGVSNALDNTSAMASEVVDSYKRQKQEIESLNTAEERRNYAVQQGYITQEEANKYTDRAIQNLLEYETSTARLREMKQEAQRQYEDNSTALMNQIYNLQRSGNTDTVAEILRSAGASESDVSKYLSGRKEAGEILRSKKFWGIFGDRSLLQQMSEDDWRILNHIAGIPGYATGLPYVFNDSIVKVHKGERILTESENNEYSRLLVSSSNINYGSSVSDTIDKSSDEIITVIKASFSELIAVIRETRSSNGLNYSDRTLPSPRVQYDENAIMLRPQIGQLSSAF